jgi:cation transporter-like permease
VEVGNLFLGIGLVAMGIITVFVGHYFSKKIGVFHVLIYFMAFFVLLTGVLLFFVHDRPPIFF